MSAEWRTAVVAASVVAIVGIWRHFKKKAETSPRVETAMHHTKEAYIGLLILLALGLLILGV
jgi:hypothetical protein